ncbi:hypothetical protein ACJX0J_025849, partial [Zea mays]
MYLMQKMKLTIDDLSLFASRLNPKKYIYVIGGNLFYMGQEKLLTPTLSHLYTSRLKNVVFLWESKKLELVIRDTTIYNCRARFLNNAKEWANRHEEDNIVIVVHPSQTGPKTEIIKMRS